ncbi:hypothetical protein [Pseudobacteriovorax antillogorgiicola]|uniref:Cytochrome c domain-containing protein n=1 Tax=Pseudobacteriovorax antillogorgiicola TaxID=1513793 RepID=A0A1Y6BNF2_9BACT|nr:hypothetical protein [Pseudobacteriovorax antillogorgiicola]TCS54518.1 hypothetical protein EDD56_10631 [Pseudobacteriovorax antillogorgiicola]SMF18886.1 hypothetical protein SAMN06296036_106212 [Pseudobacteriovorax antillogorgiicola]
MKRFYIIAAFLYLTRPNLALGNQLYQRCYQLITSSQMPQNDSRYLAIRRGAITALEGCTALIDYLKLDENGEIQNPDALASKILFTFQKLHEDWFINKTLPNLGNGRQNQANSELLDLSGPAAHYTYALFTPGVRADVILKGVRSIQTRRSEDPAETSLNGKLGKYDFIFGEQTIFAPTGRIEGIRFPSQSPWTYSFNNRSNNKVSEGRIAVFKHYGSGLIGDPIYILKNLLETASFRADGAVAMPRKWAKAVISDLLCRELPLLDSADVKQFVVADSETPFRTSAGCTTCHASMDQMAAVLRGVRPKQLASNGTEPEYGGYFIHIDPPTKKQIYSWSAKADRSYYQQTPRGRLLYRDFQGTLVDEPLEDLQSLGKALASRLDPYLCTSSRYLEYMTGYRFSVVKNQNSTLRFQQLMRLARDLKKHQDLRLLLKDIVKLPLFQEL